jgi:hypothetical protein
MEIWKKIKDYPNYEVNNIGQVKSIERCIVQSNGEVHKLKEKYLKLSNRGGYYRVCLTNGNGEKGNWKSVHRLVAECFIPNPENKPIINHINGIPTDNNINNLEWCTHQENSLHAHRTGLQVCKKGEKHHNAKLTNKQALEIRNSNLSSRKLAVIYGVSRRCIKFIINNITYKICN